jgi:hypothetical protein
MSLLERDGYTKTGLLKRKYKKKIGCSKCSNGKIFKTDTYTPFHGDTYSIRCDCTRIPSNKYNKAISNTHLSKLEYDEQFKSFYDNHLDKNN